jgi:hypothetical protein
MERATDRDRWRGLAGLCCARSLAKQGIETLVLEASDRVGGRVRTEEHEGPHGTYRIDRGFQVYLDAYPEGRSVLDHEALRLGAFEPGAAVWTGKGMAHVFDPFPHAIQSCGRLRRPVASVKDILPLAGLHRGSCAAHWTSFGPGPSNRRSNCFRKRA